MNRRRNRSKHALSRWSIWFRAVRRDDTDTAINHEITSHHQCLVPVVVVSSIQTHSSNTTMYVSSPHCHFSTLPHAHRHPQRRSAEPYDPYIPSGSSSANPSGQPSTSPFGQSPTGQTGQPGQKNAVRHLLAALVKPIDLRCLFCFPLAF
jgi:hypothetical protein